MVAMDFSGRQDALASLAGKAVPLPTHWPQRGGRSLRMPAPQRFAQSGLHFPQVVAGQFLAVSGEIENIDRHLPLGVNQSNFDVALVMGETRGNRVQKTRPVLGHHLYERTV